MDEPVKWGNFTDLNHFLLSVTNIQCECIIKYYDVVISFASVTCQAIAHSGPGV